MLSKAKHLVFKTKLQRITKNELRNAFTLLELLLVIAIIASLAGLIINALNPAQRLQEANEARYMTSANDIEKALEVYAVENGGNLPTALNSLSYGYYEICKQGQSTDCVNIDALVPNYLQNIPEDTTDSTAVVSGYKLKYDPSKKEVEVYSNSEYSAFIENGSTLSYGLVGYWKMDESSWNGTSGEVKDSSGNNLNGTAVNGAATDSGIYGNSGSLDGVDDFIITNNVNINEQDKGFTTSVWVYTTSTNSSLTVMAHGGGNWSSYGHWSMQLNTNRRVYFRSGFWSGAGGNGTVTANSANNVVPLNQWFLLTGTGEYNSSSDETTLKAYINNQLIVTSTQPGKRLQNLTNRPIIVGGINWSIYPANPPQEFFSGLVDDARLYNRVLNIDEINAIYTNGAPPVAHWKFDEGVGTTAYDSSDNGFDGILYNNPIWVEGRYGGGLEFDGVDDTVNIADSNTLSFQNDDFTVGAWIYGKGYSGTNRGIVAFDDIGSNREWSLFYVNTSTAFAFYSTNSGNVYSSFAPIDNRWYYLTGVVNGNTKLLYVDGVLEDSGSYTSFVDTSVNLTIGNRGSQRIKGVIDDVRIYNYARTPEQIVKDMNNQ